MIRYCQCPCGCEIDLPVAPYHGEICLACVESRHDGGKIAPARTVYLVPLSDGSAYRVTTLSAPEATDTATMWARLDGRTVSGDPISVGACLCSWCRGVLAITS